MGLFRRKREQTSDAPAGPAPTPVDGTAPPHPLEALGAEVAALRSRLDAVDAASSDIDLRVRAIDERFATPLTAPPVEAPPRTGGATEGDVDLLRALVARLEERIDGIDLRITTVSTELANQLTELGGELESLSRRSSEPPAGDAGNGAEHQRIDDLAALVEDAVEALRDSQERLAAEQARYQIAFRQDLADLAERLRRPAS